MTHPLPPRSRYTVSFRSYKEKVAFFDAVLLTGWPTVTAYLRAIAKGKIKPTKPPKYYL